MKLHDILNKAADVITERGHCKFVMEDEHKRVCLSGAVAVVLGATNPNALTGTNFVAHRWLDTMSFLHAQAPEEYSAVRWNNAPDTTEQQVIDFLREAAIAAKEQETT